MSYDLTGRTAVITGASSGIGAATARRLSQRGANVALLARRNEHINQLASDVPGAAVAVVTDVTRPESVKAAADTVHDRFGTVDLVVNNAGVMLPAPITERRTDLWDREITVNMGGVLAVIDAFLPDLVDSAAAGDRADLVNISSVAAQYVFPNLAVYNATKAAVTHLSRTLRAELGPKGIRVTAIEPGLVTTELQGHGTDPGIADWLARQRDTIEWLSADDIAGTIEFTVSQPKHVNLTQVTVFPTEQV